MCFPGDKLRLQWAEKELMGYHMMWKPSYNLDVKDVPPPSLIKSMVVMVACGVG